MPSARQISAYEKRLQRIADQGASALTAECLFAVAEVVGWVGNDQQKKTGTLVSITHRAAPGLFGMTTYTDVTVCTACVHRPSARCTDADQIHLDRVILADVQRNTDGSDHA